MSTNETPTGPQTPSSDAGGETASPPSPSVDPDLSEIGHYVATAHPPGSVFSSAKCAFLSPEPLDVVIAKSNRLEIRRFEPPPLAAEAGGPTAGAAPDGDGASGRRQSFPLVLTLPVNGRLVSVAPVRFPAASRDFLFLTTEKGTYALISYDTSLVAADGDGGGRAGEHYPVRTHATGSYRVGGGVAGGRGCECGPLMAVDPLGRCIALHVYDGFLTVLPLNLGYDPGRAPVTPWGPNAEGLAGEGAGPFADLSGGSGKPKPRGTAGAAAASPFHEPFHLRIEERTLLSLTFLRPSSARSAYLPQLALLHQDARGFQHVVAHGLHLSRRALVRHGQAAPTTAGGRKGGRAAPVLMPPTGEQLRASRVEGGSAVLIAVPPPPAPSEALAPADGTGGAAPSKPASSARALGGVLVLGQRQITYHSTAEGVTRLRPTGGALLLSHCRVVETEGEWRRHDRRRDGDGADDVVRYLIGDDRGRLHLLSLLRRDGLVTTLHFDTLGTAVTSSCLTYLGNGTVFVGSQFGDSQLVQILDAPVPATAGEGGGAPPLGATTYLAPAEEYANLGPIVDFALRPCGDDDGGGRDPRGSAGGGAAWGRRRQSLIATCSGVGKDGTVRLVRNGVGLREHAAVEMEGIKGMWSLRRRYGDADDAFLVQAFVRETRMLGVTSVGDVEMEEEDREGADTGGTDEPQDGEEGEEEQGGALAEVTIPGFCASKSTLFAGNLLVEEKHELFLQVVEDGVRLVDAETLELVAQWSPFRVDDEESDDDDDDEAVGFITVAAANESGQIVLALRGGALLYLRVEGREEGSPPAIRRVKRVTLDREISCIDLHPFSSSSSLGKTLDRDGMDVDDAAKRLSAGPETSQLVAVGLWDDFSVRLLNLGSDDRSPVLDQVLRINLGPGQSAEQQQLDDNGQHMMARSLCFATMDSLSTNSNAISHKNAASAATAGKQVDMLLVGLGDGKVISFVVNRPSSLPGRECWSVHSRKEVSLGTQGIHLIPFRHGCSDSSHGGLCVLATGDRPTVVYLTGGHMGGNSNPKLNYSTLSLAVEEEDDDDDEESPNQRAIHRNIAVNVATPFRSTLLFPPSAAHRDSSSSLCVADDNTLRLGVIDDIQKLHVAPYKLGMTPRRICYHEAGRAYFVGCIGGTQDVGTEANQDNCVRVFDDSTFEELNCIKLEPFEMILSVESVSLSIHSHSSESKSALSDVVSPAEHKPYVVVGTAYAFPDEDEPSKGRVILIECSIGSTGSLKMDLENEEPRQVQVVTDLPLNGGIYSIAPFYGGNILVTVGSKTLLLQLYASDMKPGDVFLNYVGFGHHGHLISLCVKSLANSDLALSSWHDNRQLAIVGDLMRSIALIEYYPKHQVIEEVARDFNSNFCTEIAMLTNNIYMGSEGHNNFFVLQYNPNAATEQARVRLDTVAQFHLGEMVNKMIGGSLIMPSSTAGKAGASVNGKVASDKTLYQKIDITTGSQTLYSTVDGTIGSILGLGGKTFAFLNCLQRAMDAIVRPVGDLSRAHFRAWEQEEKKHAACGFVDGDWVETFLDLNRPTMEQVVMEMNKDARWKIQDEGKGFDTQDDSEQNLIDTDTDAPTSLGATALTVEDVLTAVEEMSMLH